jgi:hypothetical protein
MSAEVLLRVVGRFLFVPSTPELTIIAVDMTFNPKLGIAAHQPQFVADGERVGAGREHATGAVISPVANTSDTAEYTIWSFDGCDVTFDGLDTSTPWSFPSRNGVPVLAEFQPGAEINPAALATPPSGAAVAGRVHINAGVVTPAREQPGDKAGYVFQKLSDSTPVPQGPSTSARILADALEIRAQLKPGAALGIIAKPFNDGSERKVTIAPVPVTPAPLTIVNIMNVCPTEGAVKKDVEFAALYELIRKPAPAANRSVPVHLGGKGIVGSPRCMLSALIA